MLTYSLTTIANVDIKTIKNTTRTSTAITPQPQQQQQQPQRQQQQPHEQTTTATKNTKKRTNEQTRKQTSKMGSRARAREPSCHGSFTRANLVSTHPTCKPTRLTDRTDHQHSKQDKKTTLTDITNDPNLAFVPPPSGIL